MKTLAEQFADLGIADQQAIDGRFDKRGDQGSYKNYQKRAKKATQAIVTSRKSRKGQIDQSEVRKQPKRVIHKTRQSARLDARLLKAEFNNVSATPVKTSKGWEVQTKTPKRETLTLKGA